MDVWLLGGAAIVLIAITLWIVWPSRTAEPEVEAPPAVATAPPAESPLTPAPVEPALALSAYQTASEPWSSPTLAHEPVGVLVPVQPDTVKRSHLGIGPAIALALTGAVGGAWLYARWQRRRHARPPRRLKKRLFS